MGTSTDPDMDWLGHWHDALDMVETVEQQHIAGDHFTPQRFRLLRLLNIAVTQYGHLRKVPRRGAQSAGATLLDLALAGSESERSTAVYLLALLMSDAN